MRETHILWGALLLLAACGARAPTSETPAVHPAAQSASGIDHPHTAEVSPSAHPFARTTAGAVGMSSERLARLRPALQRHVDAGEVAGAVALVLRDGKLVALETVGHADVARDIPMRPDALFRIASMTKPLTSLAVLMLYEEGRLLLTDPLENHLPEFADPQVAVLDTTRQEIAELVPAARSITIRDLLTHRSGLTYPFLDDGPVGDLYRRAGITDALVGTGTMDEMVRRVAAKPLVFHPGSDYQYGLSADVLGRVVEVVSGQRLDDFFRERIFEPLSMSSTYFYVPDEDLERLAVPYTRQEGRLRPVVYPEKLNGILFGGEGHRGSPTFISGGGGLISTPVDYARFAQMLVNGGELDGARILSRKTLELMLSDHVADLAFPPFAPSSAFGYGLIVIRSLDGRVTPGTPGSFSHGGVYGTYFWGDPEEGIVGVLMAQRVATASGITQTVRAVTYQAVVD